MHVQTSIYRPLYVLSDEPICLHLVHNPPTLPAASPRSWQIRQRKQPRPSPPRSKRAPFDIHFTEQCFSGVVILRTNIEERAVSLARYIIENRATVRAAAKKFEISKSTVHKDLSQRLPQYNKALYEQVRHVLDENKAQRHIRGGMATRKKYQQNKEKE